MQNNFEKQVRQKMEELSFNPTPPVWQNIESQIRIKKERRRGIIWFLLILVLTGAGLWYGYGIETKINKNNFTSSVSGPVIGNEKASKKTITRQNLNNADSSDLSVKGQNIKKPKN